MLGNNRFAACSCLVVGVTCVFGSGHSLDASAPSASEPKAGEVYSPVAPVPALLHAVRLNLKLVQDWLGNEDFDSAAETADRVKLLLDFCDVRGEDASWHERVAVLRSKCDDLIGLTKKRDATASVKAAMECLTALGPLDQDLPQVSRSKVDDFEPPSSIRPLMKLLDATYADAKLVKSFDELKSMAYTIAEGVNVAQFMRSDSGWREKAGEAREAALRVAMLNRDTDLKVARQELKNVYARCQACHKEFRR